MTKWHDKVKLRQLKRFGFKGRVGKFEKPARDTLFVNIPIAMNILSALTKNP